MHSDVARAHALWRHFGEAIAALLRAEQLALGQVQTHVLARQFIRDLLVFTGREHPANLLRCTQGRAVQC